MAVDCKVKAVKKFLARQRSVSSTTSSDPDLKDSDIGGSDPDVEPATPGKSGLTRIFFDACRFGEVLEHDADAVDEGGGEDESHDDGNGLDGDGGAAADADAGAGAGYTLKARAEDEDDDAKSIRHFADLVGRDLSQPALAVTTRLAKISVNDWLKSGGGDALERVVSAEPEPMNEAEAKRIQSFEDKDKPPEKPRLPLLQDEEHRRPFVPRGESVSKLSSKEIVNLLIEEFGSLTTSDTDEERLLAETDGAYFQDIVIIGMIHLTTHRLTFHASLLSTRPDLLPDKQIIKQGPVTMHRSGFHGYDRKRRVWLELSHDMLTSFPSGNEEDRIKPIRSMLLSSIKEILPEDPSNPTIIRIQSYDPQEFTNGFAEFDTEESAREWRREFAGALYLFRHRREEFLYRPPEDERNGVRISVPLSRMDSYSIEKFMNIGNKLTIKMNFLPRSSVSDDSSPASSGSGSESEAEEEEDDTSSREEDAEFNGHTLGLCVLQAPEAWDDLKELIERAKEREVNALAPKRRRPKVIVDFGALSFVERKLEPLKAEDAKEQAIRHALSLGQDDKIWYVRARLPRGIAPSGYLVVTPHYIGFWGKCFSLRDIKYRFPVSKVIGAQSTYRYRIRLYSIKLLLREQRPMHIDFRSEEVRDEVIRRIKEAVDAHASGGSASAPAVNSGTGTPTSVFSATIPNIPSSPSRESSVDSRILSVSDTSTSTSTSTTIATSTSFSSTTSTTSARDAARVLSPLSHTIDRARLRYIPRERLRTMPKVINLPADTFPRLEPQHYVCLTIGSRGDVQPYIALALGLKAQGHTVTIVTHAEYKEWVEGWGVNHRTAGGDPGALMKLSVEHKMFSPQFFKESLSNFRSWLDELLVDAWEQCKDADILLESPSAMAGVHIAEALNIPYFRCFTMPWTKTAQFPHPFLSPPVDLASFNTSSYILFDNVFWSATSGQINRWRRNTLHIANTDMGHMAQSKIPFIYNFSPSVVPKPLDWGDHYTISGYWFLDNPDLGWTPPESLLKWMDKAREDGKPIVYIGFGSITVPNPPAMTRSIIKAVIKSDVRAIVSKGWSSRMSKPNEPEQEFPPECYPIDKIPHDWLFPQIDAALHHGGAGTTGASLRAGIPTLLKPWFGDQFFWASRVQRIGAGMKVGSLSSSELARALTKATSDRLMKERAASIGEKIRQENGVQEAIRAIYTYIERAVRERPEA